MKMTGINHKTADIGLRERFEMDAADTKKTVSGLIGSGHISECVIISTCNRTEIYYNGDREAPDIVKKIFEDRAGDAFGDISEHLLFYEGKGAVRHLFRVACGMDSMVLGEDQILGQTKDAFQTSVDLQAVHYEFNMIFKAAVTCAKRVKTDTRISKSSVSTATLAANEAASFKENVNVMLIGATGKIGSVTLKDLASHKNVNLYATQRRYNSDLDLRPDIGVKLIDFHERYSYMDRMDVVISATRSPHYTVSGKRLREALETPSKRLFIDMSVPRDMEENISEIEGVTLLTIDHFEELAKKNNEIKKLSAGQAEDIINEETDKLYKELSFHDFLPEKKRLSGALQEKTMNKILFRLKEDLDSESFSKVLKSMEKI